MSDLIDRQAAIDEIVNTVSSIGRYDNTAASYGAALRQNEIIDIIEKLPSAESEFVRCKDCEYYTEEERWCRRLGLCGAFDQNDYCSHAERRADEQTK